MQQKPLTILTLGDLVQAVSEVASSERETVTTVLELLRTGRVRLGLPAEPTPVLH